MITIDLQRHIDALKPVISTFQLSTIVEGLKSEESSYFQELLTEMAEKVNTCPRTYDTDGQGKAAKCVLHYFGGGSDFYVVELDVSGPPHVQAYGVVVLNGGYPELGYFDLETVTQLGLELDLHYDQQTVGEVMRKHN